MSSPVGATRRQVLVGGAATIFSLSVPSNGLLSSLAPTPSGEAPLRLRDLLHVVPVGSSVFEERLEKYYPGLLSLPGFEVARPLTLLIRNRGSRAAIAVSAEWSIRYPAGDERLYRYAAFFRPNKLLKASRSGQYPVIRPGRLCVFSPFFCWTPARFKSVARPNAVLTALRQEPIKNQLSHEITSAVSIKRRLDAAIFEPQLLLGSDKGGLGSFFTIARNAEQDEAASLLDELDASSSESSFHELVAQHATVPIGNPPLMEERTYRRARVRYAILVQRALRHSDKDSVLNLLKSARSSSTTVLSRRAT